ncbi:MAG: polymer-forming cytoskeletal protein [Polyangia bacterium]
MASTKTTIGSGTKIIGQVASEEDLTVEGQIEGGPLRVRGRLFVNKTGSVSCEDTEVGDALVAGVFQGTLKARDAVRVHVGGRVLGEIMATRVSFVSDQQLASLLEGGAVTRPTAPAPAPAPVQQAPAPAPAPVQQAPAAPAPVAPPPSVLTTQPVSVPAVASPPGALAMPHAEPPPAPPGPAAAPAERTIPALPSLGQRAMQRRD